jgi:hypothetical protein
VTSRESARSRVRVDQCVSVRAVEVCLRNRWCHVTGRRAVGFVGLVLKVFMQNDKPPYSFSILITESRLSVLGNVVHTTKTYRGSRSISPPILNFGTKCIHSTLHALVNYLQERILVPTEQGVW